jgi:uncharacterized protein (TIGR02145 family)
MTTSAILNWLFLFSMTLIVTFVLASCNKDDENDNIPTSPTGSVENNNPNLNPNLTYGSVTDQNGNTYATIVINEIEWMAENLRTSTYCNGDSIPLITDNNHWGSILTSASAYYDNDEQHENTYGRLYNWYAAVDERNICPCGWHVPSDSEWVELTSYLGGEDVSGGKMKSTGTQHWLSPNTDATNESGFSGLPGGYRGTLGNFEYFGARGYWWGTGEVTELTAVGRFLRYDDVVVSPAIGSKTSGFSVRCTKD